MIDKDDEFFWSFKIDQIKLMMHCIENELLRVNLSKYERIKVLNLYLEIRDFYHTALDHDKGD